ncbi:MAG: right-handed parallel beta-helix repeat-containing protein [Cyanobacteria bacterium P01_F01_bin.86]
MNDFDTSNISSDASSWQQADFDLGLSDQSLLPKTSPNLSSQDSSTLRFAEDDLALNAADNTSLNNDGTLVIEAEDLTLRNYKTKSNKASSNGEYITVRGKRGKGTATGVFNGPAGTYDVVLGYYDESDGKASVDLTVAGDTQSLSFDEDLGSKLTNRKTLTSRTTHTSIELNPGDVLELTGWRNKGEHARIDRIEFVPVGLDPTPEDPGQGGGGDETPVIPDGDTPTDGGADTPADNMPEPKPEPEPDPSANQPGKSPEKVMTEIEAIADDVDALADYVRGESFEPKETGKTYHVSPNGSNSNPGTKELPWKDISFATSEASPVDAGDTILVGEGTYTEKVELEKSGNAEAGHIHLKADGEVIIKESTPDIRETWNEGVIDSVGQGFWVIDGFTIKDSSWAGISLRDANDMVIQNNHTIESGASGIIVMPNNGDAILGDAAITNRDITVINNIIEEANNNFVGRGTEQAGGQEALSLWGVDGFNVAHNVLYGGNKEGIDVKVGSRNGVIHNNAVTKGAEVSGGYGGYQGGPAIYVDGYQVDSFNIDITNNLVFNNRADGITIGDEVPEHGDTRDVKVSGNLVWDNGEEGVNGGVGLTVQANVNDVEVFDNVFDGNVQALQIDGTTFQGGENPDNVLVYQNVLANSKWRPGIIEDASNVTLADNLFTGDYTTLYTDKAGVENLVKFDNRQVNSKNIFSVSKSEGIGEILTTSSSKKRNRQTAEGIDFLAFDKRAEDRIPFAGEANEYDTPRWKTQQETGFGRK